MLAACRSVHRPLTPATGRPAGGTGIV